MSSHFHIIEEIGSVSLYNKECEFKNDVLLGLSQKPKKIPSKFFYDDEGCLLFDLITRHPDYYLTNSEIAILEQSKNDLADILGSEKFNLIELGVGEGIKTEILIQQFLINSLQFTYTPIDISSHYLKKIIKQINAKNPELTCAAIKADYLSGLRWLTAQSSQRNLVIFLGSSIGNFDLNFSNNFLHHVNDCMHPGDFLLIGFDLRKDIATLLKAYDDSDNLTKQFNLNLLKRMNRELQAEFDLQLFDHLALYNEDIHAMESYLISLEKQKVKIAALNKHFFFQQNEAIHVEYSFKYSLEQIENLAKDTGFKIVRTFFDPPHWFADSLWQKI